MYHEDDLELKLDANGNPDMHYYMDVARQMRAEVTRDLARQAAAAVRRKLQYLFHVLHLDGHHASVHH